MKSRNIIKIVLMVVVAIGAFLFLHSAGPSSESESCKESIEQCTKKKAGDSADKMIWENLSQQFFSSI